MYVFDYMFLSGITVNTSKMPKQLYLKRHKIKLVVSAICINHRNFPSYFLYSPPPTCPMPEGYIFWFINQNFPNSFIQSPFVYLEYVTPR